MEVFAFIRSIWDDERINHQEQFLAVFMNGKGKTLGYRVIGTGGMHSTLVDIRLIAS